MTWMALRLVEIEMKQPTPTGTGDGPYMHKALFVPKDDFTSSKYISRGSYVAT
jgi:hypothetical protein